jgi:hypothetical protein
MTEQAASPTSLSRPTAPLLELLNPREQTWTVLIVLALGLVLGSLEMWLLGWPLWGATVTVLVLLLVPGVLKWRADLRRYGLTLMVLSVLLVAQGFHGFEHVAQWFQYHVLRWSPRQSGGLISPANAEWIHFVWNWTVLLAVIFVMRGGMRNVWAWLLLIWATAHTLEHTYLFVRYLQVLQELREIGITNIGGQGLPGILGRDGWLVRSPWTHGTIFARLPGLTTAIRLDVHFWWNVGETTLLFLAAHTFLRSRLKAGGGPMTVDGRLKTDTQSRITAP